MNLFWRKRDDTKTTFTRDEVSYLCFYFIKRSNYISDFTNASLCSHHTTYTRAHCVLSTISKYTEVLSLKSSSQDSETSLNTL